MFNKLCVKAKIATENFIEDQKGVTAVEYAIIGVAVSALVLAVFVTDAGGLKAALKGALTTITSNMTSANNGA